jgi:undecaprenyl-diphosphatase
MDRSAAPQQPHHENRQLPAAFGWWSAISPKLRSVLPLGVGVAVSLCAAIYFLELADDMREGDVDRFDDGVLTWIAVHRSPAVAKVFLSITSLGAWPVLTIFTMGTSVAMLLAGERRVPLTLTVAMAGSALLSISFKTIYARERPTIASHLESVADPSFPSGHTISSVAFFVTVALLVGPYATRPALRVFFVGYALLIGVFVAVSRVYLGVHYPSDVAGGALLGIAWSLACVIAERLVRSWSR